MPNKRNLIREPSITCNHTWHVDIPKCVHSTDTQSLVMIKYFRHKFSTKMYENTKEKHNKIKGRSITCIHIWHICDILFSDIEQCFRPAPTKNLENQIFGHIRIN